MALVAPVKPSLSALGTDVWGRFKAASQYDKQLQNYNKQLMSPDNLMGQYQDFYNTGGGLNVDAIRNRAIAPSQAVFSNSMNEINRMSALQGGYSPGRQTALSRLSREMGQGLSDASMGAEAGISQMQSQNRLGALQGISQLQMNKQQMDANKKPWWQHVLGAVPMVGGALSGIADAIGK